MASFPAFLIPSARHALAAVAAAALIGVLMGLTARPSDSPFAQSLAQPQSQAPSGSTSFLPSFSLPDFGGSSTLAPVIDTETLAGVLPLDEVLAFSRDLQLDPDRSGPADSRRAAAVWPNADEARRRLEGWGRGQGYLAFYVQRRPGPTDVAVLQVWADIAPYRNAKAAQDALSDTQDRLTKAKGERLTMPTAGEASSAVRQRNGSSTTTNLLVRQGALMAWVAVTTVGDGPTVEALAKLGQAMADRMGAAQQ